MPTLRSICVYCGSSDSAGEEHRVAAAAFGPRLAERQITLIFGGGRSGLMGVLADSALEAGGMVVGVIPKVFNRPSLVHAGLQQLHVVGTLHERKAMMADLAEGFVALPGGLGTLEELLEILTWSQIGLHRRPVGVLNVGGYFDPLLQLIDHAHANGYIDHPGTDLLISDSQPDPLLERMAGRDPLGAVDRHAAIGGKGE